MRQQAAPEAGRGSLSCLLLQLLRGGNGMGACSADPGDPLVQNTRAVEPVHDLRQGKMNGRGSLEVIEEQDNLHPGTRQFFDPG